MGRLDTLRNPMTKRNQYRECDDYYYKAEKLGRSEVGDEQLHGGETTQTSEKQALLSLGGIWRAAALTRRESHIIRRSARR